jgi:hypothetical protein
VVDFAVNGEDLGDGDVDPFFTGDVTVLGGYFGNAWAS